MEEPQGRGQLTEFNLFPKLPIELRIIIWGFATLEPAWAVQVSSTNIKRRLHYIRPVPAILQVCQESRQEFLAADSNDKKTLQSRQPDHPVYTLHTSGGRTRNNNRGFYMSTEIDTFWVLQREDIGKVSVAQRLKHLAVRYEWSTLDRTYFKRLSAKLPMLETLTLLLPVNKMAVTHYPKVMLDPEIDGQLDPLTFGAKNLGLAHVRSCQQHGINQLEQLRKSHPQQKLPVIKWRFEEQAIEAENIVFPEAPEDPYEEIDRESEAFEKRRKNKKMKEKKAAKKASYLASIGV
ncbi:uncharacterized protein PAC_17478 [Phialocephala subalpina]|uniref:2EXR domain-containing protein n=1 Tax=Phialocephala subalpina TaxID=576137 RepID=A0A1L7XRE9_9HELO|nr:uncharacterized protein PAC_17478 [Phialocephala subalpina]